MSRAQLQRLGRIATALAVALILVLTLSPSPPGAGPLPSQLGHVLMFALLGVALAIWYATADPARRAPRRMLLAVLLVVVIIASATELAQSVIPNRHASLVDWVANLVGAAIGLFGGSFVVRTLVERDRES